jgi:hypothetical protein
MHLTLLECEPLPAQGSEALLVPIPPLLLSALLRKGQSVAAWAAVLSLLPIAAGTPCLEVYLLHQEQEPAEIDVSEMDSAANAHAYESSMSHRSLHCSKTQRQ